MPRYTPRDSALVVAQANPPERVPPVPPVSTLRNPRLAQQNAQLATRQRFGRAVNMDVIELALRQSYLGVMRTMTDICRETVDTDPHLAAVLQKRFGAAASLPYEVHPAEGYGIDKAKAFTYALIAREQLANLANFREALARMAWGMFDNRAVMEMQWIPTVRPVEGKKIKPVTMLLGRMDWIHPRRIHYGPYRELRVTDDDYTVAGRFPEVGQSLAAKDLVRDRLWRKYVQWTPHLFCDYQERDGLGPRCMIWSFFKRFGQRERMILMELFGKPFRVVEVEEESTASIDDLLAADEAVDALGGSQSVRMPRGTHLNLTQPGQNAGQVHSDVIAEADRQISKLVLGQTGTTDPVNAGMNSKQSLVMQDEQYGILQRDARALSEMIEDQVTDAIIEVNYTAAELGYAPRFVLRYDKPADRSKELERLKLAEDAGLAIARAEAYEVSGFRQPEPDEAVIKIDQPPTPPLGLQPPPPRPVEVYPHGRSPEAGEQQPIPSVAGTGVGKEEIEEPSGVVVSISDASKYVTVNEARAGQGLGPLKLPDGTDDPNGNLTIYQFEAMLKAPAEGAQPKPAAPQAPTPDEPALTPPPEVESEEIAASLMAIASQRCTAADERIRAHRDAHAVCCGPDHEQPRTAFGSPEQIMRRGERELWRATKGWAETFSDAVEGLDRPLDIYNAVNRAAEDLDLNAYSRPLERRTRQSCALGILDHAMEIGWLDANADVTEEADEEFATAARERGTTPIRLRDFSLMPFAEAMRWFRAKDVMPRAQFDRLTADLKRRAFTVAGVQAQQMLDVIHDELAKQVGAGADLRSFQQFMSDRLKSAGMIPSADGRTLGAGHVETVFRTNVLNTYNGGRVANATQPAVLRAFPVWEYRAVADKRTRPTHLGANGKMILANDPIWQTIYPPCGFNCRCRVISRPATYLSRVVPGASITGLPDPGFVAGIPSLI